MHVNIEAINIWKLKFESYRTQKAKEIRARDREADILKKLLALRRTRLDEFTEGFNFISNELSHTYQALTGGSAELGLVDGMNPFLHGIKYDVRPPKKTWKLMHKLSGGEKTICSLALIFSLHRYRPNPLYFMDEIDAALDYKNVEIIGRFIKERTKDAQFIVISLRNTMFELADTLVGIYKTRDNTKTMAIEPQRLTEMIYREDPSELEEINRYKRG